MSSYWSDEEVSERALQNRKEMAQATWWIGVGGVVTIALFVALILGSVWAWKSVKVWSAAQDGKAVLAEAEYSRQVQLEEAKANLESERLNAEAEVVRAEGAAQAIEIEGGQLSENYIRYLWIRKLNASESQLIYVPTEGGLPILEASRTP